jgi:hypothetical protein
MLSPQETGTIPGLLRGAGKAGKPVFTAGVWTGGRRVAPGRTGNRTARTGEIGKSAGLETVRLDLTEPETVRLGT